MMAKYLKYQYRSGLLFYIFFVLGITFAMVWSFNSKSVKIEPDRTLKIVIIWLWWFLSLMGVLVYHFVRWSGIFKSPERFLLLSSPKFKPFHFLFGGIAHAVLDVLIFSVWFNLVGAIMITPKKYILDFHKIVRILGLNDVFIISVLFFTTIYFWYLTTVIYWNTIKSSSKWGWCLIFAFVVLGYIQIKISEFIGKINLSFPAFILAVILFNFAIYSILIFFNLKALKKGLDT
ncbi:conserved hypothetical protein [Caldicellulosiruptor hydrothermalis 108]|uniref:Uncharacterized protein n=1 Tax=Caldicellulosiruptor hydrothermalis (strain DSM 18901 / VKM B-2411 / 108) TaxID=632292 RepID=E4QAL2_CALH1|nr:hypothetical protein [Caldicellulosiruptor hydrothermalis]ADQ05937.1 conserved hypothetical protein [Caldicellulosiruptor hydrothermalis 108]